MKKIVLFLAWISFSFMGKAQTWYPIGPDHSKVLGFGAYNVQDIFSYQDTVYAVMTGSAGLMLKKYNGLNWETIGAPIPGSLYSDFHVDSSSGIYCFYADLNEPTSPTSHKGTVKKIVGGNWITIGPPGFTGAAIRQPDIKTNKDDSLFVLFTDPNNGNMLTVLKYNGATWGYVGTPLTGDIHEPVLAFDSSGTPVIAYSDHLNLGRAMVMTLSGNQWIPVGNTNAVSQIGASSLSLLTDPTTNNIYVSFIDAASNYRVILPATTADPR